MSDIAENLRLLRLEIARQARACGRDPASIRLIAVSKNKTAQDIAAAHAAGQLEFSENYAQEFRDKREALANLPLTWHFTGHLQANKAKYVVGHAALIHTVDRLSLAETLNRLAKARGLVQQILIEVRVSTETTKSGCAPHEVPELVRALTALPQLRLCGFMTIGSLTDDRAQTQKEFCSLRDLRDHVQAQGLYPHPLPELSMGMSSDFDLAIAEGATLIRIGTRIFGER